jgi:hypothetical protein
MNTLERFLVKKCKSDSASNRSGLRAKVGSTSTFQDLMLFLVVSPKQLNSTSLMKVVYPKRFLLIGRRSNGCKKRRNMNG